MNWMEVMSYVSKIIDHKSCSIRIVVHVCQISKFRCVIKLLSIWNHYNCILYPPYPSVFVNIWEKLTMTVRSVGLLRGYSTHMLFTFTIDKTRIDDSCVYMNCGISRLGSSRYHLTPHPTTDTPTLTHHSSFQWDTWESDWVMICVIIV